VPFPVLVFDPPSFAFTNLPDQFETTLLVKVRNEGLISMSMSNSSAKSPVCLAATLGELHAGTPCPRGSRGSIPVGLERAADWEAPGPVRWHPPAAISVAPFPGVRRVLQTNILDGGLHGRHQRDRQGHRPVHRRDHRRLICSLIVTLIPLTFIMGFFGLEAIAETLRQFLLPAASSPTTSRRFSFAERMRRPAGGAMRFARQRLFPGGNAVTLSDGTRIPSSRWPRPDVRTSRSGKVTRARSMT